MKLSFNKPIFIIVGSVAFIMLISLSGLIKTFNADELNSNIESFESQSTESETYVNASKINQQDITTTLTINSLDSDETDPQSLYTAYKYLITIRVTNNTSKDIPNVAVTDNVASGQYPFMTIIDNPQLSNDDLQYSGNIFNNNMVFSYLPANSTYLISYIVQFNKDATYENNINFEIRDSDLNSNSSYDLTTKTVNVIDSFPKEDETDTNTDSDNTDNSDNSEQQDSPDRVTPSDDVKPKDETVVSDDIETSESNYKSIAITT